jgi:FHA domain
MFLKYIDFIFVPFRRIHANWIGIRTTKGNIQAEMRRMKNLGARGQAAVGDAQAKLVGGQGQYQQNQQQAPQQGGQAMQSQMPPMPQMPGQMPQGMPGAQGAPGAGPGGPPGAINPGPPIRTTGFWIFKKKFCTQCNTQLDNSWDRCPYCAQIAVQAAAPKPAGPMKTQAFVIDSNGVPGQLQLIGWVVPLSGAQRGQLFTLTPMSTIGNDPACTVVLHDRFMSGKHAEIKAENGMWVLKDLGSTNGTYVNNRRVERHELVDNDFIKFGGAMVKFKSL